MNTFIGTKKKLFLWSGVIILVTVLSYIPAMRGGYIWDDDSYITENTTLRTSDGLRRIWLEPRALPQYYPLVHTTFWIEYHLWHVHPFGYHLVNVSLHALNAILLLLLLSHLRVPGAWLAALLFALHPVQVESVAWITERKNILSAFFYLASFLAYLRYYDLPVDSNQTSPGIHPATSKVKDNFWPFYPLSFFLFLCALLSKTITCSLPAAILLVLWWKRDRIYWRDIQPLIPYFVVGAFLGLTTVWLEIHHVGAQGEEWALSFVDRLLVAGRALWFYASKLVWPHKLTFIYPKWQVDAMVWWQYLFPVAAMAVIFTLWLLRHRIGKGPLVAVLFFAGTLIPALGFFDIYPMRYSFVADHFQYLASMGLIALGTATVSTLVMGLGSWQRKSGLALCLTVLLIFAIQVWQQGTIFKDAETLYQDTITKNPNSWMAHNNLGLILKAQGRHYEAIAHFSRTLQIKPDYAEAHNNLGNILALSGEPEKAIAHFIKALELEPNLPGAHNNLGNVLERQGKINEALYHYSMALQLNPAFADAYFNLGNLLARQGKSEEAIVSFSQALQLKPEFAEAHNSLGVVLARQGKLKEAIDHFREAIDINPHFRQAHRNLSIALQQTGGTEKPLTTRAIHP
jgi:tetratricopeptide (TPR) repeat protein